MKDLVCLGSMFFFVSMVLFDWKLSHGLKESKRKNINIPTHFFKLIEYHRY